MIASEASRTLTEMRLIVRLLRSASSPERAPIPKAFDLELLAHPLSDGPSIDAEVSGPVDELSPAVSAAVYRLAQESITNARRHAHEVTRIEVLVLADEASVRLRVSDDGVNGRPSARAAHGFGLIGMKERAETLGGTFEAGPVPEGGLTVSAILPIRYDIG
ncbi:MAG: ATP-binding protein [Trueperaceae bacterium]